MSRAVRVSTYADRGNILGHNLYKGRSLTHVMQVVDSGPGAMSCNALCNGVQSWTIISTGLERREWPEWKKRNVRFVDWPRVITIAPKGDICPKCQTQYIRRRERALGVDR